MRKRDEIFGLDETVAVLEIGGGIFSRAVAQIRGFKIPSKNYIFGYHPHRRHFRRHFVSGVAMKLQV